MVKRVVTFHVAPVIPARYKSLTLQAVPITHSSSRCKRLKSKSEPNIEYKLKHLNVLCIDKIQCYKDTIERNSQ